MKLTLTKKSALWVLRALRSSGKATQLLGKRCGLIPPNPSPWKTWSQRALQSLAQEIPSAIGAQWRPAGSGELLFPIAKNQPLSVAVPNAASRIRSKSVSCSVYENCIPENSFVAVDDNLAISSPELLFIELAAHMNPVEHLMLGHELCGTFSRDAQDPFNGPIKYGVKPATSVERIKRFAAETRNFQGSSRALASLSLLNDNAWSPTESLVAALFRLPVDSTGYDLGPLVLNPRVNRTRELPSSKESRVPDIVFAGTNTGVNYDGLVHLNLESIAKAALDMAASPGVSQTQIALDHAMRDVRAKVADDIRRNRELAVEGMTVFPLLKEDLYTPGGLDQIVGQLVDLLESQTGRDMSAQRKALKMRTLCRERHRVMLSLLPGKHERDVQIAHFIEGREVVSGPREVHEFWIEL